MARTEGPGHLDPVVGPLTLGLGPELAQNPAPAGVGPRPVLILVLGHLDQVYGSNWPKIRFLDPG